jgi:hypothetical protein
VNSPREDGHSLAQTISDFHDVLAGNSEQIGLDTPSVGERDLLAVDFRGEAAM